MMQNNPTNLASEILLTFFGSGDVFRVLLLMSIMVTQSYCLATPVSYLANRFDPPPTATQQGNLQDDSTQDRVALVIGNAEYEKAALQNPINDTIAMTHRLSDLGFQVEPLNNLTHESMWNAVTRFGERLSEHKVGLLYYSGHGLQYNNENYLLPVDIDIDRIEEISGKAVKLSDVLDIMTMRHPLVEPGSAPVRIVILDACRTYPSVTYINKSPPRGLAPVRANPGVFIAYATEPGNTASDNPHGPNGLYTFALLNALQPGVRIEDVFMLTRREVLIQSQQSQRPWEEQSLTDPFVF